MRTRVPPKSSAPVLVEHLQAAEFFEEVLEFLEACCFSKSCVLVPVIVLQDV